MFSYINSDTAEQLTSKQRIGRPGPHQLFQLADGTTAQTQGEFTFGCVIEGVWKSLTFQSLPNLTNAIILGMDALQTFGMRIDIVRKEIIVHSAARTAAMGAIQQPTAEETLKDFLAEELPKFGKLKGVTPNENITSS